MIGVKHVTKRGNSYLYERRVPRHVQHLVRGGKKVKRTLGRIKGTSPDEVRAKAAQLDRDFEAAWDALLNDERDAANAHIASAHRIAKLFHLPYRTVQDLAANATQDDFYRRIDLVRANTPDGQEPDIDLVAGLLGGVDAAPEPAAIAIPEDASSATISEVYAEDAALFGRERTEKPVNLAVSGAIKCLGDAPFASIDHAKALKIRSFLEKQGCGPATVCRRLGPLRAIWERWARRAGVERRNPFTSASPKVKGAKTARLPFHLAHIEIVDRGRFSTATGAQIALMRATGIGPEELAGLDPRHDLVADAEVPHVWVRENARRKLKTGEPRDRRIPLVGIPTAEARLALLKTYQKNSAGALSAKVNKALRAAGMPVSSRLTGYSFRHTLKQALRDSGADAWIADRIMGHSSEKGAPASYGSSRARLEAKAAALRAAQACLGSVDLAIYDRAGEMPPALKLRARALEAAA